MHTIDTADFTLIQKCTNGICDETSCSLQKSCNFNLIETIEK